MSFETLYCSFMTQRRRSQPYTFPTLPVSLFDASTVGQSLGPVFSSDSCLEQDEVEEALVREDLLATLRQVSEACPRARWRRDIDVDGCEHPGCLTRFGRFGMPGITWSSPGPPHPSLSSTARRTSLDNNVTASQAIKTRLSSPFSRTTSNASLDFAKLCEDASSPRKDELKEACATLSRTLVATLPPGQAKVFDTVPASSTAAILEDTPLPMLPSTPTLLSPKSSIFGSSLDSNSSSQRGAVPAANPFGIPRSPLKLNRRHHCRRCGSCFCSEHSSNASTLILASKDVVSCDNARNSSKVTGMLNTIDEAEHRSALDSILEDFSPTEADVKGATLSSNPMRRLIRARVCDGCHYLCQKAKNRLEDVLRDSSVSSTATPPSLIDDTSLPNGGEAEIACLPASMIALGSGWSTPTIIEHDEEYFQSKERIKMESQREQKEAIKLLCNDPKANRVVAKAASASRMTSPGSAENVLTGCSSPLVDCGLYGMVQKGDGSTMGCQLATASLWEKVERKRKNEELARRAMSLDSLMKRNMGMGAATSNRASPIPLPQSPPKRECYSDDEDEEVWNVQMDTVVSLSKSSIFDRRCSSRPPSPQPIRTSSGPARRGSEGMAIDPVQQPPFALSYLPSSSSQPFLRMGANRLQRSFDSNQRSQAAPTRGSRAAGPA